MKGILYLATIFVFSSAYSQQNKLYDCNLQMENSRWKIDYEKAEDTAERIDLIKSKIRSDSIYTLAGPRIRTAHSATIINEHLNDKGVKCGCTILFILQYKQRDAIILNLNERPELSRVLDRLNSNNVEEIRHEFVRERAKAFYGVAGQCGFVQLRTNSRILKHLIKERVVTK